MGLYWIQKRSSSANLRLRLSVFQQSQIHKIHLVLSSSALLWFHTERVRISVVQLISLHHLHQLVMDLLDLRRGKQIWLGLARTRYIDERTSRENKSEA